MPNLIKTCGAVVGVDASIGCSTEAPVGFPIMIVLGKLDTPITATAEVPTPAEVQTYLTAGNGYLFNITNGKVLDPELITKSGADTYTNATEVITENNGIEGVIKKINNDTLTMFRQNTLNNQYMRLWFVDNQNRWHGGKNGYIVSHHIPEFSHGGYGEAASIKVTFKWTRDLFNNTPISLPNEAYKALFNKTT